MFIVRSAFWLAVGFALVAPHGTNFGAAAEAVKDQAISAGIQAGAQIVAAQTVSNPLVSTLIASSKPSTPSVDLPMQDSPTKPFVFPRPRPAAMG